MPPLTISAAVELGLDLPLLVGISAHNYIALYSLHSHNGAESTAHRTLRRSAGTSVRRRRLPGAALRVES